jgi:hypothetical protein
MNLNSLSFMNSEKMIEPAESATLAKSASIAYSN